MLELKYITYYLPFSVKVERIYYKNERFKILSAYDLLPTGELDNIRLILHPLSDLIKEIEINGEKFIPYKKIGWGNGTWFNDSMAWQTLSFSDAEKLLEWHFDIFGLINKGLANDINRLS